MKQRALPPALLSVLVGGLLVLGGSVMLVSGAHAKPASTVTSSAVTPDAYEIDGETPFHFSQHKDKWIIIHYWSDWCRSCVKEIPTLNAFIQKHPNVVFRGVHLDDPKSEKQLKLARKYNIKFPLIHQVTSSNFPKPKNIDSIPTTLIFAPNSTEYEAFYGPVDLADLEAVIAPKAKAKRH